MRAVKNGVVCGYAISIAGHKSGSTADVDTVGYYDSGGRVDFDSKISYGSISFEDFGRNLIDSRGNGLIGSMHYGSSHTLVDGKPQWWWADAEKYWDSSHAKKLEWVEMEDGSLVSEAIKTEHGRTNLGALNCRISNSEQIWTDPSGTITYKGSPYSVRVLDMGRAVGSDESSIRNGEFFKYIRGSKNGVRYGGIDPDFNAAVNIVQPYQWKHVRGRPNVKLPEFENPNSDSYTLLGQDGSGTVNASYVDRVLSTFLIAQPAKLKPWAAIEPDYGTHAVSFDLATPVYDSGDTLSWTIKSGGKTVASASGVSKTRPIRITSAQLQSLGAGRKTLTVEVSAEGGKNAYTTAVTVVPHTIAVKGHAQPCERRPKSCTLASAAVVGKGGSSKWWVSNNAADASPTWEVYEGESHEFANKAKTAAKWALAWKCEIGGENATGRSELIKQVAMGVIYE